MKILNINALLNPETGGGTSERTIQMSRYLSFEKGIEVSIMTLDLDLSYKVCNKLEGIDIKKIPCINKRFFFPAIFNRTIAKSIKDADVVHLMGHWTIINLVSYFWIKKYKKPFVVCPAGALPIFGRSKVLKKLYNFFGGKAYIQSANINIAISKDEFNHFHDYGVDEKKIILLPNGIELNSYKHKNNKHVRTKFNLGVNPFLLFVGRLNLIKGPDLLLEAFNKISKDYPDYLLIFAGKDDGLEKNLKAVVKKNGLEKKVRFIGFVQDKLKSELYHAADLLVIPSRLEAMSIVVLESAVTGTPVLMTDTCGLNEMSGENGAYSVFPDSVSIEDGLRDLLLNNDELVLRGKKIKNYVESFFSWSVIVNDYVEMYENILSTQRK
jgi:glycosyltransferase involved in cell wall biosynthesis